MLGELMPDGQPWPKISIVTPSYNQGDFIEETIRSVLLQGYPNLEYIIIDGGSSDQALAVIRKYEPWITHWVSESDRGQADALNKGFARATGEVRAYINSDDLYEKEVFHRVAVQYSDTNNKVSFFTAFPVEHFGATVPFVTVPHSPGRLADWLMGKAIIWQPGVFWSAELQNELGGFDTSLHYSFDEKFFIEAVSRGLQPTIETSMVAARYRYHSSSKTVENSEKSQSQDKFFLERKKIRMDYLRWLPTNEKSEVMKHLRQVVMSSALKEARRKERLLKRLSSFVRESMLYKSSITTRFFWGSMISFFTSDSENGNSSIG